MPSLSFCLFLLFYPLYPVSSPLRLELLGIWPADLGNPGWEMRGKVRRELRVWLMSSGGGHIVQLCLCHMSLHQTTSVACLDILKGVFGLPFGQSSHLHLSGLGTP